MSCLLNQLGFESTTKIYQENKERIQKSVNNSLLKYSLFRCPCRNCFMTNYPVTLSGCSAYSHSISCKHMTRMIIQRIFFRDLHKNRMKFSEEKIVFWGICMKIELSSQRRKKAFVLVIQHGHFDVRCKILSCKSNINNINNNCSK